MKRFWKDVSIGPVEGGWRVLLDGRGVKTPGGRAQVVPSEALAQALAEEWAAQGDEIDPAGFMFRDMADYALDVVAGEPAPVLAAVLKYGETDTLCYRGEPGEALTRRQESEWEPLLAAAEMRFGVGFVRVAGVMHRPQPAETLAVLEGVVAGLGPLRLAAVQNLASLAASLVVALAALEPGADLGHLWNAASLEEDWQAEMWGRDAEAEARRERRGQAFLAAAGFAAAAGEAG
jgi:chaperone required for assembly of F1-ATPase